MARLGDVCTIVSGTTPKTNNPDFWDGDINWITPAELSEDTVMVYESKRKITLKGVQSCGLSPIPAGTVILSSRAPIGKTAIAGTEMYCNQGFKNLICSEKIFNKYLFWFLRCNTEYLNTLGRGATFKEISKAIVEDIEIPLPDLPTQRCIADTLDKVSEGVALCKRMLADLDELVKSQFIELFGDPNGEILCWPEATIGDNCFVTKLAGFEYTNYIHYSDSGDVVMVKAQNVKNGSLNEKELSYISNEVSDSLPRSQLAPGDIVMTYVGANIGDVAIIDDRHRYHLAPNVAKIRPCADIYNPTFFMYMLMMKTDYIMRNSADTAKAALGMERIRKLSVITPPIELQNIFAAFVTQIDKSKLAVQQQLAELETLKKSLMQEYFR